MEQCVCFQGCVIFYEYMHVHVQSVDSIIVLCNVLLDFGNRPRRLYVVVNPASGEGNALRVWNRVERLFHLTHITTELMCE